MSPTTITWLLHHHLYKVSGAFVFTICKELYRRLWFRYYYWPDPWESIDRSSSSSILLTLYQSIVYDRGIFNVEYRWRCRWMATTAHSLLTGRKICTRYTTSAYLSTSFLSLESSLYTRFAQTISFAFLRHRLLLHLSMRLLWAPVQYNMYLHLSNRPSTLQPTYLSLFALQTTHSFTFSH